MHMTAPANSSLIVNSTTNIYVRTCAQDPAPGTEYIESQKIHPSPLVYNQNSTCDKAHYKK